MTPWFKTDNDIGNSFIPQGQGRLFHYGNVYFKEIGDNVEHIISLERSGGIRSGKKHIIDELSLSHVIQEIMQPFQWAYLKKGANGSERAFPTWRYSTISPLYQGLESKSALGRTKYVIVIHQTIVPEELVVKWNSNNNVFRSIISTYSIGAYNLRMRLQRINTSSGRRPSSAGDSHKGICSHRPRCVKCTFYILLTATEPRAWWIVQYLIAGQSSIDLSDCVAPPPWN